MIILIDTEKAFNKIQHLFRWKKKKKNLSKLRRVELPQPDKEYLQKT